MDSEFVLMSMVGKIRGNYTHFATCLLTQIGDSTMWEVCPISSKTDGHGNHSDEQRVTHSIEASNDPEAQQAAEDLVRKQVAKHLGCRPKAVFFQNLVWKTTH